MNEKALEIGEALVRYRKNYKEIKLCPLSEDKKDLHKIITDFLDKESCLTLLTKDSKSNKRGYRYSSYLFREGIFVEVSGLEQTQVVNLRYDNISILKDKTYYLLQAIKDSLGIELSINCDIEDGRRE